MVLVIGFATAANVLIGGHFPYTAIEYMDSVEFCGSACHIMNPEHAAYKVAPHAQVHCVDCHIGEGAGSYVKAKLNGARQLWQVLTATYHTPVPTPVHNLAQGNLTCSGCHANRDFGNKRWQAVRFASNASNSATLTQLAVSIGGGNNAAGAHGAHLSNLASIEYRSTPDRKKIEWIRYRDPSGHETIFATANAESSGDLREMDCTDCHNRAAHNFENPSDALDRSLAAGRIDHTLPEIETAGLQQLNQNDNIAESLTRVLPEPPSGSGFVAAALPAPFCDPPLQSWLLTPNPAAQAAFSRCRLNK